jgi:hypothetical protein
MVVSGPQKEVLESPRPVKEEVHPQHRAKEENVFGLKLKSFWVYMGIIALAL